MYCVHCGAQIDETMRFCPQCGASLNSNPAQPLGGAESPLNASCGDFCGCGADYDRSSSCYDPASRPINDFLLWNIFATALCCMPFGLVGLVFSLFCNSAKARGDFQRAYRHAQTAKTLFWISVATGVITLFVYACGLLLGSITGIEFVPQNL